MRTELYRILLFSIKYLSTSLRTAYFAPEYVISFL